MKAKFQAKAMDERIGLRMKSRGFLFKLVFLGKQRSLHSGDLLVDFLHPACNDPGVVQFFDVSRA